MRLEDYLKENTKNVSFARGSKIVKQGEQAGAAYFIKSGKVGVYTDVDGHELLVTKLGEGEIFGEMAILRYDDYTMTVKAEEATELYVITPDLLHGQLKESPPLIQAIMGMLLDRIHEVNEVLTDHDRINQS